MILSQEFQTQTVLMKPKWPSAKGSSITSSSR